MKGDYDTLRAKVLKYAPALTYLYARDRAGLAFATLIERINAYPSEFSFSSQALDKEGEAPISDGELEKIAGKVRPTSAFQLFGIVLDFAGTPKGFERVKKLINEAVESIRARLNSPDAKLARVFTPALRAWFDLYELALFDESLESHAQAVENNWITRAEAESDYANKSSVASRDAFKREFFAERFRELGQVVPASTLDMEGALLYNIKTALPYGFLDLYSAWTRTLTDDQFEAMFAALRAGNPYKPRGGKSRSASESSEPAEPAKKTPVQPSATVKKAPVQPSPAIKKAPVQPSPTVKKAPVEPADVPPRRPSAVKVPPRPSGTATPGPPAATPSSTGVPRASGATARSRATAMSSAVARSKVLPNAPLQERPAFLPGKGGVSKTVARLKELNAGLLQREAAFPTLLRLQSIMDNLVDTCYGERWKGVYEDPQAGLKSDYDKKTLLTGVVRFVQKPATLPLGDQLFLKAERYIDLGGGPPSDEVLNEIAIGTRLNMLIEARLLRGFVRMVDWYLCRDNWTNPNTNATESIATAFTLQEIAPERLVDLFIAADERTVVALMANLLLTLETAQSIVGYVHNDLHLDNVHVAELPAGGLGEVLLFQRPNGSQIYLRKDELDRHEVKLIDYGRNRMQSSYVFNDQLSETISMPGLTSLGIGPHFDPYYDMRLFAVSMTTKKGDSGRPLLTESRMARCLDLLNEASGHRYVAVTEKEYDKLHGEGEWADHRDTLQTNASPEMNLPKTIPAINNLVTKVLTLFREGGLVALANRHAAELPNWEGIAAQGQALTYSLSVLIVASFWVWSSSNWPGLSPEGLLDLPVFDSLRSDPNSGEIEQALEYRSISTFKRVGKRV